jgi:hypothetical protein
VRTQQTGKRAITRVRSLVAVSLFLFVALGTGCSEDPTEANSLVADLPLPGLVTKDTTLQAVAGFSVRLYSPMDGTVNLVGRAGSYSAVTIVQFTPTTFPTRDTVAVYSARLTFHAVSWYGTKGAPFGFTVYRVNQAWSPFTLIWDSLQTGSFYDATIPRGRYPDTMLPDSSATITVDLDTSMVREWFATSTTATTTRFGIVLVPSPSTQNAVSGLLEFGAGDSASYVPTLQVIAGSPTGLQRDTSYFNLGIDTFVGTDDHSGAPPGLVYVQSGVNYRGAVRFDLSTIPRGAIVNAATLYLDRDPATSRISAFVPDTALAAHIILDTVNLRLIDPEDATTFGRRIPSSATTFGFNIRKAAQSWIRGPNYGVMIRVPGGSEYSTANLYTFYSPAASSPSVRPRLKLVYSLKSN